MPTIDDELIQNAKAVFKSKVKHSEDVTFDKNVDVSGNLTVNSAANIKDKSLTSADAGKVLTVSEDGSLSWQQKGAGGGMKEFFDAGGKCSRSTATSFDGAIPFTATSNVKDMSYMFYYCNQLTSVPLFDTSNVTSMEFMFNGCERLTSIPLLDTSKVTNMNSMFSYCEKLTSIPLFDTSKVTNMGSMFSNCPSLTSIPSLDTRNVTNMEFMFVGCSSLRSIPSFDVSEVTRMYYMLRDCSSIETIHMINIGADLDISPSTKFTREALLEIIGNLKTVTTTKTLTMGDDNLDKLTNEDKAIATNTGWTLA